MNFTPNNPGIEYQVIDCQHDRVGFDRDEVGTYKICLQCGCTEKEYMQG